MAETKNSGLAVASLLLGVGSVVTCGLTAIPAVICGHLALSQVGQGKGTGKAKAVIGLVFGYIFIALLGLGILGAIINPDSQSTPPKMTSGAAQTAIPQDVTYTVIDENSVPAIKRSLDIRLNRRVSPDVLKAIATELKNSNRGSYERTFIGYYLPDMRVNAGYWATSHFNPDLDVKILGTTKEEHARLQKEANTASGDDVIGRWMDKTAFPGVITFFRRDGKIFKTKVFQDGSKEEYEMVARKVGSETRYMEKNSKTSDYVIIKPNGDMGHGDNEGLWATSPRTR